MENFLKYATFLSSVVVLTWGTILFLYGDVQKATYFLVLYLVIIAPNPYKEW